MKTTGCPRRQEVDALQDGYLTAAERASFEQHCATCAACAAEVSGLRALRGIVQTLPHPARDVLTVRRSRKTILARLEQPAPPSRSARSRSPLVALAAASLALVALGVWWVHRVSAPSPLAPPSLSVTVHAQASSMWTERRTPQRREILVTSGEISVSVQHGQGAEPLIMITPDGEIEDIGTVFSVQVRDGVTRQIEVDEGQVRVRLRGLPELHLGAGQRWSRPEATASNAPPSAPPGSPDATPPSSVAVPLSSLASLPAVSLHPRPARAPSAPASSSAPGAYDEARAEDTAYLHILALQRSGQADAMRTAAARYLERYPTGFRVREVKALLATP